MKVNRNTFSGQHQEYAAPEVTVTEVVSEGILCFSTENLEEDNFNPWA